MFRLIYTMPLYKVCLVMVLLLVLWAYYRAYLPKKLFWSMNLCVLVLSAFAVLYLTVFSRKVGTYDIVLVPFSALSEAKKEPERYRSMLMNVFLFFPLGMACANAFSDKMKMRRRVILVVAIGQTSFPKRKRPAIADRFHYSIKLSSSKKLNSSSSKCLSGNLISYCSCANARTSGRLSFSRFFSQDNCSFDSLHGRFKRRFSVISSACFSAGSEAQDLQMWDA
mgnify:CR=1 FL=1